MTDIANGATPVYVEKRISFMNIVGYACVNFLGGGSTTLISAWLMYFYTTMCGIDAVSAGLIFASARIFDALLNPVMGFITDNFYKTRIGRRFGRRRFFILMGIPSIMVIFPAMWLPNMGLAYYWFINLLYEMCFTMVIVSCVTLPAEMTKNAADKAKMTGGKQMCGIISSTIAAAIPGLMFKIYGQEDPTAFVMTGVVYGIMMAISLVVVWKFTYERKPEEVHVFSNTDTIFSGLISIISNVKQALKLRAYRLHCTMLAMGCIYKNIATGVFTYFVVSVIFLEKSEASWVLSITQMTSFAALCLCIWMCYRFGSPRTYRIFTVVVAIGCAGYYGLTLMIGSPSLVFALTAVAIVGMAGRAGIDYIPVFQLPFMADIDEIVHGERREGIFTGVNTLFSRAATGIESLVLGLGLAYFGYTKGTDVQTPETQQGIMLIVVVSPIVLLAIGWWASTKLSLTKENHKTLCQEVARLRAGGKKEDVDPEVRAIVEDLTGYSYEKCWTIKHNVDQEQKA
ncbi:MAG: MFS transporter [Succinivibrionaceae bacterium]|nr:MFS transporter [Succinivibrionaceae bacterium]